METVLLTGANRGLGLEFARQYAARGWRVIATCRRPAEARDLAGLGGEVEIHPLDVDDFDAIESLAAELEGTAVDLLLNNAGVLGPVPASLGRIDYAGWQATLATNALAPLRMAECFRPHVARSGRKLIVSLSSRMGSIGENASGGDYIYRSSKAALNMVMKSLSLDLRSQGITVAVLHPGWAQTDMGGPSASVGVAESVSGMARVIDGLGLAQTGSFHNYDASSIDW